MIAKCANPNCNVAFRYLRGGKLFLFDISHDSPREGTHRREYYWLCDQCSAAMKVVVNESGEVVIAVLPRPEQNHVLRPAA